LRRFSVGTGPVVVYIYPGLASSRLASGYFTNENLSHQVVLIVKPPLSCTIISPEQTKGACLISSTGWLLPAMEKKHRQLKLAPLATDSYRQHPVHASVTRLLMKRRDRKRRFEERYWA
jgi:hypothetical protein